MATQRDTQRNRIIRAEDAFHKTQSQETVEDLQVVLEKIQKRAWFKRQVPPVNITIDSSRGYSCIPQMYRRGTLIDMSKNAEGRIYLLHSLAHILTEQQYPGICATLTPHNPEFTKNYLELVRRYMDPSLNINEDLKREFKKLLLAEGVKTKLVSEATRDKQRAAMITRLTPTPEKSLELLAELENM